MELMAKKKLRKNTNLLITGGCSFTFYNEGDTHSAMTWPKHLQQIYQLPLKNSGLGSQGNGMISRKLMYDVHTALKTTPSENLIVGVMWSGPSRHEQYISEKINFNKNIDGWVENPTNFVSNDPGGWLIYNSHWKIPQAKNYYRYVQDNTYSQVQTLEHIIRVQNYLKLNNIKYFMSTYTSEVLKFKDNPNLDHLYEQIDLSCFLPVTGCYEWVKNKSGLKMPKKGDNHPSSKQHQRFALQVIVPFLKKKYNIDIPTKE